MLQKLTDQWICEWHPKEVIKRWVQNLDYFYFYRDMAGHGSNYVYFKASIQISGREDLLQKLQLLEIAPQKNNSAHRGFETASNAYPGLKQPGHSSILGQNVFIWIYATTIDIQVSGTKDGNLFMVTEEDFNRCRHLELFFKSLGQGIQKAPEDTNNPYCISKSVYPEYYIPYLS